MPDRHGPWVPHLPEPKPDPTFQRCEKYVHCTRRDGHPGPCLPDPKELARLKERRP